MEKVWKKQARKFFFEKDVKMSENRTLISFCFAKAITSCILAYFSFAFCITHRDGSFNNYSSVTLATTTAKLLIDKHAVVSVVFIYAATWSNVDPVPTCVWHKCPRPDAAHARRIHASIFSNVVIAYINSATGYIVWFAHICTYADTHMCEYARGVYASMYVHVLYVCVCA